MKRFILLFLILYAGLCGVASAQVSILSNVLIRAGRGVLLGTASNTGAGMLSYSPTNDQLQVWSVAENKFVPIASGSGAGTLTGLYVVGSASPPGLALYSNNPLNSAIGYLQVGTNYMALPYLPTIGGTVTGPVSFLGGITVSNGANIGTITGLSITGSSSMPGVSSYSNNPLNPTLGYLQIGTNYMALPYLPTLGGTVTGSVVILGGLTVSGTQTINNAVTINSYTQYNLGVSTNFIYTTVYSTNVIYQTVELNVQTNINYSTIDAYYGWNFIGAYLNATGAPFVWTPHIRDTLTNRLDANGIWSFSNATIVGVRGDGSVWSNVVVTGLYPTNTIDYNQQNITNVASLYLRGPVILNDNTNSYVQFPPLSTSPSYTEGRLFYDTNSHTLAYFVDNPNVTMNIGQELWVRAKNTSGATITNGQPVHISGSIGNDDAKIDLAQATTNSVSEESNPIGLATQDILNNEFGYVCVYGVVHDLDTSGFVSGLPVYMSTNIGRLTQTLPPDGYVRRALGTVLRVNANNGSILVTPRPVVDFSTGVRLGLETTNRINADIVLSNSVADTITNVVVQYVSSPTNFLAYTNNAKIGYLTTALTNGISAGAVVTNELDPIFLGALTNYLVTNVVFSPQVSPSNYIAFTTVSVGTAYIKYTVTNGSTAAANGVQTVVAGVLTSTPTRLEILAGAGHSVSSVVAGATTQVYVVHTPLPDVFTTSNNTFIGGTTQLFNWARASNIAIRGRTGGQLSVVDDATGRGLTINLTNSAAETAIQYSFSAPDENILAFGSAGSASALYLATRGGNNQPSLGPDPLDHNSTYARSNQGNYTKPGVNLGWYNPDTTLGSLHILTYSNSSVTGHRWLSLIMNQTPNQLGTNYAGEVINSYGHGGVIVNAGGSALQPYFAVLSSNTTYWTFLARPWDRSTQRARAPRLVVTTNRFNTTYTNNFGFAARIKVLLVLTNTTTDSAIISLQTTSGLIVDTATCPSGAQVSTNETSIEAIANVEDTWSITNRSTGGAGAGILRTIIVND